MRVLIIIIAALVAVSSVLGIGLRVPEELENRVTFEVDEIDEVMVTVAGDDKTRDIEFYIQSPVPGLQVSLGNGWGQEARRVYSFDDYENIEIEMEFKGAIEELDWFWVMYGFSYSEDPEADFGFEQVTESAFEARVRCYGCDDGEDDTQQDEVYYNSGGGGGGGGGSASLAAYLAEGAEAEESESPTAEAPVSAQDIAGQGSGVDEMVVGGNDPKKLRTTTSPSGFLSNDGGDAVKPEGGKLLLMAIMVMLVVFMGFASLTYKAVKEDVDL
jgi:hypothetical protein